MVVGAGRPPRHVAARGQHLASKITKNQKRNNPNTIHKIIKQQFESKHFTKQVKI